MSASVYLLHFPPGRADAPQLGGHFLGVTPGPVGDRAPAVIVRGPGRVATPAGATVADVWDCDDLPAAQALAAKFRRQGSRRRLCSVCSPGNRRGDGRGSYARGREAGKGKKR